MFADQIRQAIHCLRFRDVELYRLLPNVEVNLARSTTDVAEISIRHFPRAVDNATHHRNANALEVARRFPDFLSRVLEIEKGASTTRTCNVVRLENTSSSCLKDIVGQAERLPGR